VTKRKAFEEALVSHLQQLMFNAAERRGGLHKILNDLFYTETYTELFEMSAMVAFQNKQSIDMDLTSAKVLASIENVELNAELQPIWTYRVTFPKNEWLDWDWAVDDLTITIEPDSTYKISIFIINDEGDQLMNPPDDDPLWDDHTRSIRGNTLFKTLNPLL
jgi:hypothetical protein